jgi:hypothetical protein
MRGTKELLLAAALAGANGFQMSAPCVAHPRPSMASSYRPPATLLVRPRTTELSMQQPGFRPGGGPPGLGPGGGGPGFNAGSLIQPIILVSLLASGALGWIFNGVLFILAIPLVVGPIVSWYIQSNLVEGTCPECSSPAQVLKGQQGQCLYCGSPFSSEKGAGSDVFLRTASPASGPFGGSPFGGPSSSDDGVVEVEVLTDDDYKK